MGERTFEAQAPLPKAADFTQTAEDRAGEKREGVPWRVTKPGPVGMGVPPTGF